MMRRTPIVLTASSILLLGAAPADPPESPISFVTTDELKGPLDRSGEADKISRTGLVVFY